MPATNQIQRYHVPAEDVGAVPVIGELSYNGTIRDDWRTLLVAYLAQKDVNSPETLKTYRKSLTQYFKWVDAMGLDMDAIGRSDILVYRSYLVRERHCSSMTVAAYLVAVKGFYEWAAAARLYPNIAKTIHTGFDKEHIKMHLTREQTGMLLDYVRTTGPRNYAMVNLMLRCGLRTIEVSRANVEDLSSINGQRILYIQGKGRQDKKRWVVLREAAWEPIAEYLSERGGAEGAEPLFACEGTNSRGRRLSARSVQDICKRALRAIGLDSHQYSAHSLRHTTGVRILDNGGSVSDVQEVLGHSSIDTSRIYLKSAERDIRVNRPAERFLDDIA